MNDDRTSERADGPDLISVPIAAVITPAVVELLAEQLRVVLKASFPDLEVRVTEGDPGAQGDVTLIQDGEPVGAFEFKTADQEPFSDLRAQLESNRERSQRAEERLEKVRADLQLA